MSTEQAVGDLGLAVVYAVCGLALFALGEAVALASRRSRPTRFAAALRYLAAFGFLGAVATWIDAAFSVTGTRLSPEAHSVRVVQVVLLALAGASLLRFGATLLAHSRHSLRWLLPAPWVLFGAWLVSLVAPHIGPVGGGSPVPAAVCLECHRAQSSLFLAASGSWLTAADIWARYLLYCPGAVLAGIALLAQRRWFLARDLRLNARHSLAAAIAFAILAVTAGLIVPPAPFFPASLMNYATFHLAVQVPAQLVTAVGSILVAYSVVRTLSVFEIEHARQLARARSARLAALARARAEMAEWNRQLEARVAERTRELQVLHTQLKDTAVLEERDRIARELHDSLAQSLGFLGLQAGVVEEMLSRGETEQASAELRRMAEVVDDAYADVREAILGLRTRTGRGGLVPTLREYLRKYGLQTGIRAELVVSSDQSVSFSPSVEIQALRIVQEALANVRKHARAERVVVRVWTEASNTCIAVEDDGCGFDPERQPPAGHYGLATMRERAQEVAGSLRIESVPSRGTSVIVCLPATLSGAGGPGASLPTNSRAETDSGERVTTGSSQAGATQ